MKNDMKKSTYEMSNILLKKCILRNGENVLLQEQYSQACRKKFW